MASRSSMSHRGCSSRLTPQRTRLSPSLGDAALMTRPTQFKIKQLHRATRSYLPISRESGGSGSSASGSFRRKVDRSNLPARDRGRGGSRNGCFGRSLLGIDLSLGLLDHLIRCHGREHRGQSDAKLVNGGVLAGIIAHSATWRLPGQVSNPCAPNST